MICTSSPSIKWIFCFVLGAVMAGCSDVPDGFQSLDEQVCKKLHSFGAGDRTVGQSELLLLRWQEKLESGDSVLMLQEALVDTGGLAGIVLNQTIRRDLMSLEDGASLEYWAPAAAFKGGQGKSKRHFFVTIEKCFADKREAAKFLATSASEGLRSEEECMDLFTALFPDLQWVPFNDLRIGFFERNPGDSVLVDRNVLIEYNTYLLGGERLDSLTEMEFPFGKSGQLLPAMQWGLAKMRQGERAFILTPSQWAFGTEGSPQNKIPARMPIYWDVTVKHVQP